MKQARSIATVLFYISRIIGFVILAIALYTFIVVALYSGNQLWAPMEVDSTNLFTIFLPFTKTPFLLGEYTGRFFTTTLLTMTFYGVFLWFLSKVFNAFTQKRLFSQAGLSNLSWFYVLNFTLPFVLLALVLAFGDEVQDIIRITFLHMIIGVFAYFMAAIFKQGLLLQEEQDLIF